MSQVLYCSGCGFQFPVENSARNQRLLCPRCQTTVSLPGIDLSSEPPPGSRAELAAMPVDQLFSRMSAPEPDPADGGAPAAAPPEKRPAPEPPALSGVARAEKEWLVEEKQRLESYTAQQFSFLEKQRQQLVTWQTQADARNVMREQELYRREKLLACREAALQDLEARQAEQVAALAAQQEQREQVEQQIRLREEAVQHLDEEITRRRGVLGELAEQAQRLEQSAEEARTNAALLEEVVGKRMKAHAQEEARWAAQRQQLEQRCAALEKEERALERRLEELDEIEGKIYRELEAQEEPFSRPGSPRPKPLTVGP